MSNDKADKPLPEPAAFLTAVGIKTGYGDALADFLVFAKIRKREEIQSFVTTLVNKGIEWLPPGQREALVEWSGQKHTPAPKKVSDILETPGISRRNFIRRRLTHTAALIATLTGEVGLGSMIIRGESTTARRTAFGVIPLTGAGVLQGITLAEDCNIVFVQKLSTWLKEAHGIDFKLSGRDESLQR